MGSDLPFYIVVAEIDFLWKKYSLFHLIEIALLVPATLNES
jgi:hypothetical protein